MVSFVYLKVSTDFPSANLINFLLQHQTMNIVGMLLSATIACNQIVGDSNIPSTILSNTPSNTPSDRSLHIHVI